MSNPPTPRRCRRILAAHHLDCQGLSLRQIGKQLGRAHSTVHAYLRDFQLHRNHILYTVAADQLADQIYRLTQPQSDPAQHRQTIAATRELRLLLLNPPAIQGRDLSGQALAPTDAEPGGRFWETSEDGNGHRRYIAGPDIGQCVLECIGCMRDAYASPPDNSDQPGLTESEPDQPSPNRDQSGPIQTNLDKSEHPDHENPVPGKEWPPIPQISPPRTPPWPEFKPPPRPNRTVVVVHGTKPAMSYPQARS